MFWDSNMTAKDISTGNSRNEHIRYNDKALLDAGWSNSVEILKNMKY